MSGTSLLRWVTVLPCVMVCTATAQIPFWLPEAKRLPAAAPFDIKPDARLEKDYKKEERAWADKHLIAPALQRWQGMPWAAEAEKFCRAALDAEMLGIWTDVRTSSLAPEAKKLLEAGCDDPLVAWLAWRAIYTSRGNWRDGERVVDVMCNQFPDTSRVNGALGMYIAREVLQLAVVRSRQTDSERSRLDDAIKRALADDSYDESTDHVLARHTIEALDALDPEDPVCLSGLLQAMEVSKCSPWAKETFLGHTQKLAAWAQRGSGWASSVTSEGWQGFAAHLQKARTHLEAAYKLRPERPEAASIMISVSMGEGTDLLDQRKWFDKATAAQADYAPAYRSLLWALRPRWSGSHELMAQFGASSADTKRFDTWVPYHVFVAASNIGEETFNTYGVYTAPDFGVTMRQTIEGYLDQKDLSGRERRSYASHAAVAAYLMHEPELCARALEVAGPELEDRAVTLLHAVLGHEQELRKETDALQGKLGPEAKDLMLTAYKRDPKLMRELVGRTQVEALPAASRAIFEEFTSVVQFQQKFMAGDWVPLTFRSGLTNTGRTRGSWSATDTGELSLTGNDTRWVDCFFRHPVASKDVEMRGEIEFDIPDRSIVRDGFGFGPMLGWQPGPSDCNASVRGVVMDYGGGREEAHVASDAMNNSTGRVPWRYQAKNTFHLCVLNGRVTFIVNDQMITNQVPLQNIGMEDGRGFIGFTAFRFPWGAKATVRNAEVRLSKTAPPLPAPQPKTVTKPAAQASAPAAVAQIATARWWSRNWQMILLVVVLILGVLVKMFLKPAEE